VKKLIATFAALIFWLSTCMLPIAALADGGVSDGANPMNPGPPAYPFMMCDRTATINAANASAILIAHVAGKTTYICGYTFSMTLVATTSVYLGWGTGTTCATNNVPSSAVLQQGSVITGINPFLAYGGGIGPVDQSPVAGTSDFCTTISGTPLVFGSVRYAQW
jgi:hypothetical protein